MRSRLTAVTIAVATALWAAPAIGQDPGVPPETHSRVANDDNRDVPWDMLGLLGLVGLLGLRRGRRDDGYHPAPVD